jgi:tyrosinase
MRIRRDIYDAIQNAPEVVDAYRAGVAAMKARPASDLTSWRYQAAMHGTSDDPANERDDRLWNQCQHSSFLFLSWHRMYLHFFERHVARASGVADFALPYWNYTGPSERRALPPPFRIPASEAVNALYTPFRHLQVNQGFRLPATAVSHDQAFLRENFSSPLGSGQSFGGQRVTAPLHLAPNGTAVYGAIENQPHNVIHGIVGGGQGLMNNPNLAALDPIFWLHHANIDRLWQRWLQQGGGRANPTTNDFWMDQPFTFVDEDGQEVRMSGRDVLDYAAQLDYRYDDEPALPEPLIAPLAPDPAFEAPDLAPSATSQSTVARAQGAVRLTAEPVSVTMESVGSTAADFASLFDGGERAGPRRYSLVLEEVGYEVNPGTTFEVYLNAPEGAPLDPTSRSYVGNIGFFGLDRGEQHKAHGHHDHGHGGQWEPEGLPTATIVFDATGAVGETGGDARVSFLPRGLESLNGEEARVELRLEQSPTIQSVRLVASTA